MRGTHTHRKNVGGLLDKSMGKPLDKNVGGLLDKSMGEPLDKNVGDCWIKVWGNRWIKM